MQAWGRGYAGMRGVCVDGSMHEWMEYAVDGGDSIKLKDQARK